MPDYFPGSEIQKWTKPKQCVLSWSLWSTCGRQLIKNKQKLIQYHVVTRALSDAVGWFASQLLWSQWVCLPIMKKLKDKKFCLPESLQVMSLMWLRFYKKWNQKRARGKKNKRHPFYWHKSQQSGMALELQALVHVPSSSGGRQIPLWGQQIIQWPIISSSRPLFGGGHGNPLQYSCLENPMDRATWWATVPGVAKNQTQPRG